MMKKGKCYSKVNRGQRKKSDFYETPYSMTRQFLDALHVKNIEHTHVCEPACGHGAITKVLIEKNFDRVTNYDIIGNLKLDYLEDDYTYDCVITNPPYSLADEFIEHALDNNTSYMIALLLPLNYLQGVRRYEKKLFEKLTYVYVFTRMPMLGETLRNDGKYNTGMQAYAWYVWDLTIPILQINPPQIYWINNNDYVIRKEDKNG